MFGFATCENSRDFLTGVNPSSNWFSAPASDDGVTPPPDSGVSFAWDRTCCRVRTWDRRPADFGVPKPGDPKSLAEVRLSSWLYVEQKCFIFSNFITSDFAVQFQLSRMIQYCYNRPILKNNDGMLNRAEWPLHLDISEHHVPYTGTRFLITYAPIPKWIKHLQLTFAPETFYRNIRNTWNMHYAVSNTSLLDHRSNNVRDFSRWVIFGCETRFHFCD